MSTTAASPTTRQLAALRSELATLRDLGAKILEAEVDSRACSDLIDLEFEAKARLHRLLVEIGDAPFAVVCGDTLVGLCLEHDDDESTPLVQSAGRADPA